MEMAAEKEAEETQEPEATPSTKFTDKAPSPDKLSDRELIEKAVRAKTFAKQRLGELTREHKDTDLRLKQLESQERFHAERPPRESPKPAKLEGDVSMAAGDEVSASVEAATDSPSKAGDGKLTELVMGDAGDVVDGPPSNTSAPSGRSPSARPRPSRGVIRA